jgi:integrase
MKHKTRRSSGETKTFKDQHEILGGEAVVYRTAQNGDFWQFRCWIRDEKKYYRVSLKTRDLSTATELAKKYYFDIQHQIRSNVKIFGLTWRELVEMYLVEQEQRVQTDRITRGRYTTIKSQLVHFLAFVGAEIKTAEISRSKFLEYAQWRRIESSGVKDVTLRNEHATIGALIKFAHRKGYIAFDSAEFEEIRIRGDAIGKRETFTLDEYTKLYSTMRRWVAEKVSEKEASKRKIIREFILISAQSFARFGELRQLRWKNVQVFDHKDVESDITKEHRLANITILGFTSKVRTTRTITCRGGQYFDRLRKISKFTSADDFVFCDQDTGNMIHKKDYYELWHDLITKAGLQDERNLTYYALRHFGITMRLYAGVGYEDLSDLAGTSFSNLKNHYSHVDRGRLVAAATKSFRVDQNGFYVRE